MTKSGVWQRILSKEKKSLMIGDVEKEPKYDPRVVSFDFPNA